MALTLEDPRVDDVLRIIEESTRSSEEGVKRFIEPGQGMLGRALSKRHHMIFGRRGSGKSSLLRKAAADLTIDRRPIAFVDMETFKGHTYPDVLISVLVSTLKEFREWLETAAVNPATKTSFWEKLFGTKPSKAAYKKTDVELLVKDVSAKIVDLEAQLYSADKVRTTSTRGSETADDSAVGATVGGGVAGATFEFDAKTATKSSSRQELSQTYEHSKVEFLHQHILEYQDLFRRVRQVCGGDSYLFLDDMYHIRKADQPSVIDYFHRIAKGNGLWLKIGTIQHRTNWYVHGDPPIGVKLGDDAESIDLNQTLEKYSITKEFLTKILRTFASEKKLEPDEMLNEGAVDRLVLASGGVARDFLTIFRRAVIVARERGNDARGEKVGSEDVNKAAGEHEQSKREELKRDVVDDQLEIEKQFEKITNFCLNEARANLFLIEKKPKNKEFQLIQQLVDLRLVHLVSSRVTVSKVPGKIFEAYLLDLSVYTGARAIKNLEMVKFWKEGAANLRRLKLIYGT